MTSALATTGARRRAAPVGLRHPRGGRLAGAALLGGLALRGDAGGAVSQGLASALASVVSGSAHYLHGGLAAALLLRVAVERPRRLWPALRPALAGIGLCAVLALGLPPALPSATGSGARFFASPASFRLDPSLPRTGVPVIRGRREACLACHPDVQGLAAHHNPAGLGCASCHLGDPWTGNATLAHRDMEPVPGNLRHAELTCGQVGCHGAVVERVTASMMATARGLVAVDRFAFGETETPDGTDGLQDLGSSPADSHLDDLCFPCHLAFPKEEPGPTSELARGGGCVACHLSHSPDPSLHPALDLRVGDEHCFGCHSRSGRISTNYQGWHETRLDAGDAVPGISADGALRVLDDRRVFSRQPADLHHDAGLSCIDCHTARETMGDGNIYHHQEEQVEISCRDCHRTTEAPTLTWNQLDDESRKVLTLRGTLDGAERSFVATEKTGLALVNVFVDETGTPVLEGKLSGRRHALRPPAPGCELELPGHERLDCASCHTGWAPQCLTCHTQRLEDGSWREYGGSFLAEPPSLGVREPSAGGEGSKIVPFIPGMILTLGKEKAAVAGVPVESLQAAGTLRRLFAPAVPHTIQRQGRSCRSCHNDPPALGYGRGTLTFDRLGAGRWSFEPRFGRLRDGLPADAWIGAFAEPTTRRTTRRDARPFSAAEQRTILRVGACLTCHEPDPRNMQRLYRRFGPALERLTPRCRQPVE